jgi:hypothetical protein
MAALRVALHHLNTMENEVNSLSPFRGRVKVKNKTVQNILSKRPDEKAERYIPYKHKDIHVQLN